jgi:hypothetical protein
MSSRTDSAGNYDRATLLRGSEKKKRGAAPKWTAILGWMVGLYPVSRQKNACNNQLVTTKAIGTSQRAVRRIFAVNLRRSLR